MAVSQDRLVEVETVEQAAEPPRAAGLEGTKTFRAYDLSLDPPHSFAESGVGSKGNAS